ncbi:hypothetical protein [Gemmatimonas sp.]|uniref:hypothetical protein n=1 Tax=Gemmatimonas sp. TaxID=1962908 RepID=UPI00333E5835
MTALVNLWKFVRALPLLVWGALGVGIVALALWIGHDRAVSGAYAQGKRDAAAGVVFDSLLSQRAAEVVAIRTAHTDSATRTVRRTQQRVDSIITALPEPVREIPAVDTLLGVVQTLSLQVDSLITAHDAERAAWTDQKKVDDANVYALRVLATAQAEQLEKRPRWRTVVMGGIVGTAVGALAVLVLR